MRRAQLYTSKRELKGSRFFVAHGKNERRVRQRERNFGVLRTLAEAEADSVRTLTQRNKRKVRPREQNFEVLQTSVEVEAGTARTLTHEE